MDMRGARRLAQVSSEPPVNRVPASAIAPLKERLTQLKREFTSAPESDRPRIATAIAHVEELIQRLERQNGHS